MRFLNMHIEEKEKLDQQGVCYILYSSAVNDWLQLSDIQGLDLLFEWIHHHSQHMNSYLVPRMY